MCGQEQEQAVCRGVQGEWSCSWWCAPALGESRGVSSAELRESREKLGDWRFSFAILEFENFSIPSVYSATCTRCSRVLDIQNSALILLEVIEQNNSIRIQKRPKHGLGSKDIQS
ncbi:hypothetical protein B0H10DRAFT_1959419 [Mycena sp. CBHHK59/15]|nr:hypothetical protein B0H10DRAFT_1959419 [Mycena sp. CBHHK59/15]